MSGVGVTELTITKKPKKEHKEETKTEEEETAEEAPVPLVTHVNNSLHSIFFIVEVYINKKQIHNSNGLYAHEHELYVADNLKGAVSEHNGVLHCEVYDFEKCPDEIMEAPLF